MLNWIRSRLSPRRARRARALAARLASRQQYALAVETLRGALELEPRHAAAWNLMGVCESLDGRYEDAARAYAQAIECDPASADAYLNSGWNSCLLGRADTNAFFREWLARVPPRAAAEPSAPALVLGDVTLCCIDCANYELAADAMRFTLSRCRFAQALYFSDRAWEVAGARRVPISRIVSAQQYSNFVVHELHAYVQTGHALIIQYDGFVLNPSAWDPAFLRYDYVGAPMHTREGYVVGNGGFSLRSRRLLQALRDDPAIRGYDALTGEPLEDVAICRDFRVLLEQRHGIRFAPVEVAERFAAEHSPPTGAQFGFHNLIHLVSLHEAGFALPARRADAGVPIVFQAATELGAFSARREIDLRGKERFWPVA